jgi:predicted ATPase
MVPCECRQTHPPKRVVLTGGPGGGKTAVLELIRQSFCEHVRVLPEAASIVFGGGFPREDDDECRKAAQRAIYHVQRELENAGAVHHPAIILCDRGTIDGIAYWPGSADSLWQSVRTTAVEQRGRYAAVIHLKTPSLALGYNHQNPVRTETPELAAAIDQRILDAWAAHTNRCVIESSTDFLDKGAHALAFLREQLPNCCRKHVVAAIDRRASRSAAGGDG